MKISIKSTGFEELAANSDQSITENPRFELAYLRALSDYQAKCRALKDRDLEKQALQVLSQAEEIGADTEWRRQPKRSFLLSNQKRKKFCGKDTKTGRQPF